MLYMEELYLYVEVLENAVVVASAGRRPCDLGCLGGVRLPTVRATLTQPVAPGLRCALGATPQTTKARPSTLTL